MAGDPLLGIRVPEAVDGTIDAISDDLGTSRSEVGRTLLKIGLHASGGDPEAIADADDLKRQVAREQRREELAREEREIIEENQEIRELSPSKWRTHVRGLFRDDLRDDVTPEELRLFAERFRKQARKKEERAEQIPDAPEADLQSIVDEELREAIEAVSVSNWFDRVDNVHGHLDGVQAGMNERKDLGALVGRLVEKYGPVVEAFQDRTDAPEIDPEDLPRLADTLIPDRFTREDIAALATELARRGADPDDARVMIRRGTLPDGLGVDAELPEQPVDVDGGVVDDDEHDQDDDVDDTRPPPMLRMGGTLQPDGLPGDVDDDVQQAAFTLPAADGGRSEGARAAGFGDDEQHEERGSDSDPDNMISNDDSDDAQATDSPVDAYPEESDD